MGLYSVTPGSGEWTKTTPYFEKVKINFEDKQELTITKKGMKGYLKDVLFKNELINKMDFIVVPISVPVITAESKSFKDKLSIKIDFNKFTSRLYRGKAVKFRIIDEDNKDSDYKIFENNIIINKTSTIEAFVVQSLTENSTKSNTISATFIKKPNNYTIQTKSKYNPQYHAGGEEGLIDGILGSENWRKGDWQGYQLQDFEAVVDLQETKKVTSLSARFLQDSRAWILFPSKVEYYVSNDNINFQLIRAVAKRPNPENAEVQISGFETNIPETNTRYIKVKAYNFGKLPEWHQGAGGDAFIFIDEISVK